MTSRTRKCPFVKAKSGARATLKPQCSTQKSNIPFSQGPFFQTVSIPPISNLNFIDSVASKKSFKAKIEKLRLQFQQDGARLLDDLRKKYHVILTVHLDKALSVLARKIPFFTKRCKVENPCRFAKVPDSYKVITIDVNISIGLTSYFQGLERIRISGF